MANPINIFEIEENVISRDLKGRFLCIYGPEKVGKSTFGAKMPRPLFCNFEIGTNYLPVKPVNITKWAEFKLVLRQLENPKAKEMYDTVVIDTVSEAYNSCEKFICQQNGVMQIGDIPWGGGYAQTKREFEDALRRITMLGFGLCCICHSEQKNVAGPNDTVIETYKPAMTARAADVVNRMVDIIAYIDQRFDENGDSIRRFVTRKTPNVMAGSRLPYLDPVIPFSYEDLVAAIGRAIDKQQEIDGAKVVDTIADKKASEEMSFKDIRGEASQIWQTLVDKDPNNAEIILKKVEMIFNRKIKLSEITEDQVDLFYLVLLDLRAMLEENE